MNSSKVSRAKNPETSSLSHILTTRLVEVQVKHLTTLSPRRIYELDSTILSGTVSLPFRPFVGKQIELVVRVGKSSWTTNGTFTSVNQDENTYSVEIDLSQGYPRCGSQSRASRRWENSLFLPIIAQLVDAFQYEKRIGVKVNNVSMGGVELQVPGNILLFVGQHIQATLYFPFIGSLQTLLSIKSVTSDTDTAIAHCEFEHFTDEHVDYITRFLLDCPNNYDLEDLRHEHVVPISYGRSLEFIEQATEKGTEVQLLGIVHGQIISNGLLDLSVTSDGSTSLTLTGFKIHPEYFSPEIVRKLVSYLIQSCINQKAMRLHIASSEDLSELQKYGFVISLKSQESAYSIETKRALQGKGISLLEWTQLRSLLVDPSPTKLPVPRTTYRLLAPLADLRLYLRSFVERKPVSWERYAVHYDEMCSISIPYQDLLFHFGNWISNQIPKPNSILELGAGTGNFCRVAAKKIPSASITHVDRDVVMNRFAKRKYKTSESNGIHVVNSDISDLEIQENSLDLVICVHTLYVLDNPQETLDRIFSWLKPGGFLYIVDVGRPIDLPRWVVYLFQCAVKQTGILNAIKLFIEARQVVKQNRHIHQQQADGTYWVHSFDEFRSALIGSGFDILESDICYRDMSDRAVCTKPHFD